MFMVQDLCPSLCNPWTVACQAPLSMEFSRQEHWSVLPCSPPGVLPDPRIKPSYLYIYLHWQERSLPLSLPGRFFITDSLSAQQMS